MTIKDKMKQYNFWISLVSAVLLVARIIAGKFNYEIDSSLIMDVTTGLCGIFVILGIISAPQKTVTKLVENIKTIAPVDEDVSLINGNANAGNCAIKSDEDVAINISQIVCENEIEAVEPSNASTIQSKDDCDCGDEQDKKDVDTIISNIDDVKHNGITEINTYNTQDVSTTAPIEACLPDEQNEANTQVSVNSINEKSDFIAIGGIIYDINVLTKEELANLIRNNQTNH